MSFVHLHNHTQYSVLDGACQIDKMLELTKQYGMPAVAMTDHGNMFGTVDFSKTAKKYGVKPIFGMEAYVVNHDYEHPDSKADERHHLVLLVKNKIGYQNLIKLSSFSYTKGFYYRPRISKSLLSQYSEGLICLSACIHGELPWLLLRNRDEEALQALEFYKNLFKEDFYIEIQNHEIEDETIVMPKLISLAESSNTPLVVTNDCHYLLKEHAPAHDILLCIQMNKSFDDPNRMKYSPHLYFKTEKEMRSLFPNHQQAYDNTVEISEKIDFDLKYDKFLLPKIDIPKDFATDSDYLKKLCYEAVPTRYPELTDEIKERIDYEHSVITKMGFASYFLVVKDFIDAARLRDVPVGPGRGSAAGSIISYLLGITQLDPLKYGLIFERFLNPERISMPDIDIDFCAEGRAKVIDYVIEKYGRESVTQIITYGTLGAKSVIKDVARALDVPPADANAITKLMPSVPGITLKKCLHEKPDFAALMKSNQTYEKILNYSMVIEGLIRQIGIHAAGVVIGPGDLSDYVPLAISNQKDSEPVVLVQYEGKWLDDLKLLKMDFLGLKTLTIIKYALALIKRYKGQEVDIDNVDLTDHKTYHLLSKGLTDGIFQFESDGMKKYLTELKPNKFEDLIAMVALYRPGPMQFIPNFIRRKHGQEKVVYDHPLMQQTLEETYGVTVYQEQVMKLSRELAGFTGAQSDELRKAIGKKKLDVMENMKSLFIDGAQKNEIPLDVIENIWAGWVNFASYAFNKSHAACYAYVAYQTAYLKAHYPVEYMTALLSLEEDPAKIPQFIHVAKKMNIKVLPPSVNKSESGFTIKDNNILFGLQAIKNVGSAALSCIIKERDENGPFKDIFELAERVDSQAVNKATLESLVYAGAMDELEGSREQQCAAIENAISCAIETQTNKKNGQFTLFDMMVQEEVVSCTNKLPDAKHWSFVDKLEHEKSVLGFYLSGHPLYENEHLIELFTNATSRILLDEENEIPGQIQIIGLVTQVMKKRDKRGNSFSIISLEDIYGHFEISLFGADHDKYSELMEQGKQVYIVGVQNTYNASENDTTLRIKPFQVYPIKSLKEKLSGEIILGIDEDSADSKQAEFIAQQPNKSPGQFSLQIKVQTERFKTLVLKPENYHFFPNTQFYKHFKQDASCTIQVRLDMLNEG